MISKTIMFCTEQKATVDVLIEKIKLGRNSSAQTQAIGCNNAHKCKHTVFCRFVNPLTMRIPLTPIQATNQAQSA